VSTSISVTEVRNALRCPRIFALGRLREAAVAFPIGSSCLGGAFHRLVDRFGKTIATPPEELSRLEPGAALDDIDAALRHWLLGLLVDELDGDATLSTMPGELDDLAQALRELARHLAARLGRFPGRPADALALLVRDSEQALECTLGDGTVLKGTLDALYGEPDGSLEIVEYKLTDEANHALDRAQVALYRHMLKASASLSATPVVLRFLPMLRETALSPGEADDLVEREILPLLAKMAGWAAAPETAPGTERRDLCPACPMREPCNEVYPERVGPRDDPPANAPRPRPTTEGAMGAPRPSHPAGPMATDEDGRRDAERIRDVIVGELRKQGIVATSPGSPTVGPTLYEIELVRPRGSVRALDQAALDVKHRLASAHTTEAEYENRGGRRLFVIRRALPRKVYLTPLLDEGRAYMSERPGRFIVGQRPSGEVLFGDLSDSSTPHLLIGGQAGSGKSFLLRSIVASLVHYHPPSAIRFILIDPKRVTFNVPSFGSAVGAHLDGPIGYDAADALPVIERLVDVMEERYALFAKAQVSDLTEFNECVPERERLERKVVVIDEFQDLTAEKSTAKPFYDGVKRLGAKARAAGVHLVLATQRPDKDTVPGLLRANLGGKIALRVASAVNSRIVLDEAGAERLLGKGDLLANLGHGTTRAQAALIS